MATDPLTAVMVTLGTKGALALRLLKAWSVSHWGVEVNSTPIWSSPSCWGPSRPVSGEMGMPSVQIMNTKKNNKSSLNGSGLKEQSLTANGLHLYRASINTDLLWIDECTRHRFDIICRLNSFRSRLNKDPSCTPTPHTAWRWHFRLKTESSVWIPLRSPLNCFLRSLALSNFRQLNKSQKLNAGAEQRHKTPAGQGSIGEGQEQNGWQGGGVGLQDQVRIFGWWTKV